MILSAEGISKQFHRIRGDSNIFTAVEKTSLSLEPGKLYVIYGSSGSGKSTLLNMLSGLLAPTAGQVLLDGRSLYELDDKTRSSIRNQFMGFLPQGQTAIHSLNVMENVLVPYTLHGSKISKEQDFASALSYAKVLLEKTGILELADIMPSELSGGEIRRMAIARALIRHPQFLFADEPTGDLDSKNTATVLSLFRQLADEGMSIFLVSHDTDAFPYADVFYEMEGGILNDRGTIQRHKEQG